jgi:hypothetical protein
LVRLLSVTSNLKYFLKRLRKYSVGIAPNSQAFMRSGIVMIVAWRLKDYCLTPLKVIEPEISLVNVYYEERLQLKAS